MASQEPTPQLTTQHIQQKLEQNYEYLVKIVAANQQAQNGGLDPGSQTQLDQWSKQLQENLMSLAGLADKSAAGQQQPQAAAAAAQPQAAVQQQQVVPAPAPLPVAPQIAQPTMSTGSSMTPSKA